MAGTIVVKQVGSPIRRPAKQRQTLIGLGLNKMHRTRELEDTPSVRGMVNSIPHLVEIVEVREPAKKPPARKKAADKAVAKKPAAKKKPAKEAAPKRTAAKKTAAKKESA